MPKIRKKVSRSLKTFLLHLKKRPFILVSLVLLTILILVTPASFSFSSLPSVNLPPRTFDLPSVAPLPVSNDLPLPQISARHVFILDRSSKIVLYQLDGDAQVFPASTTKMMTALVALTNYSLNQVITVSRSYPIGQNIDLQPGEQLTVEQLLYAMLVNSGNDAAEVLAENFPGGRPAFVSAMNTTAEKIHLVHTRFANPTGIDEANHYSSASDLVRLADIALRNPEFSRIVSTENAVVSNHVLNNVNQLLGKIAGVKGVKTGYTEGAGQALVTLVERDDHEVLLAVLGSTDRFTDTEKLITWIYSNFHWENLTADIGE